MCNIEVRVANASDAEAICEIYRPYVEETDISFEYQAPDVAEMARRMAQTLKTYPYLVGVADGQVVGYAYAGVFKGRKAYDWSAETTIYMDMKERGRGIGSMLYKALFELLKLQNIVSVYACITDPNPVSEAFHGQWGFERNAAFHHCGFKAGHWLDMMWMERILDDRERQPEAMIPFSMLEMDKVQIVLNKITKNV